MDRQNSAAPVIIRKKKVAKSGDARHGGAWKVAFADFATAMMAFFLIMWLLNATTESQRQGLADFFNPSIPVSRVSGGGDGAFGGDSPLIDGDLPHGGGTESPHPAPPESDSDPGLRDSSASLADDDAHLLTELRAALVEGRAAIGLDERALRHIDTRVGDEGLIVEIFDLPGDPLFVDGGDHPTATMRAITELLSEVFQTVENGLAIEGHVRAHPVVLTRNPVWDLSMQRAQRTRTLLREAGLSAQRMRRVTGHADRRPVTLTRPMSRNNRLEIILLRAPP